MAGMAVFLRGWLPHRGKAQMACNYCFPHEDNVLNKFRIVKERHVQMRKPYQSPGQDEKLILLYCPCRGLNSRLPTHRSFKHGQGVPCRPVARISKGGFHFWPDPKFSSWGSGGRCKPSSGVGGGAPEANAFWQTKS